MILQSSCVESDFLYKEGRYNLMDVKAFKDPFPYTDKLAELFHKKYKYNLIEHLPNLFLRRNDKPSKIKWQYVELLQALYGINMRCPHLSWYTMQGASQA